MGRRLRPAISKGHQRRSGDGAGGHDAGGKGGVGKAEGRNGGGERAAKRSSCGEEGCDGNAVRQATRADEVESCHGPLLMLSQAVHSPSAAALTGPRHAKAS